MPMSLIARIIRAFLAGFRPATPAPTPAPTPVRLPLGRHRLVSRWSEANWDND